jgi:hypothetical protein
MSDLKPFTIDKATLKFEQGVMPGYGTEAIYRCPLGFIWYEQIMGDHLDLMYIFVHERCRRQKLGTFLLTQLRAWYPGMTVYTQCANELSEPWLMANNFEKEKNGWYLRPIP